MLQKVKDRNKVLILSKYKEIENDIFMILSSQGYSVDILKDADEAREKIIYYKPTLYIVDIDFLPNYPEKLLAIFTRAKKIPTFLIIDNEKFKEKLNRYLEYCDDILQLPFSEDNLYYKIKKAANYSKIVSDNQYYQGLFLMFKLMAPFLILIIFLMTAI
jgi:DNA-binding NtrC family response regulator